MGSSQSSLVSGATATNYQNLLNAFSLSNYKYFDPLYGDCQIYQNNDGFQLTIKQEQCRDNSDMETKFKKMELRTQKLIHPNIIQLHGCGIHAISEFCSSSYSILLPLDYIVGSVLDQMRSRISDRYNDQEVWKILESIVAGMSYLEENNQEHKCMRLENFQIVLTPNQQKVYKIIDNSMFGSSSLMVQLLIALQEKPPNFSLIYLSPEELLELSSNEPTQQYSPFQSDMFSLGINLIHLLIWDGCDDIYDWNTITIDRQKLMEKLAYVQNRNHSFYEIITSMIAFNPDQRPTFKSLDSYLNQLPILMNKRTVQIVQPINLNMIYAGQTYVQPSNNTGFYQNENQAVVYEEQPKVQYQQPLNSTSNQYLFNSKPPERGAGGGGIFGNVMQAPPQQQYETGGGGIFGGSNYKQNSNTNNNVMMMNSNVLQNPNNNNNNMMMNSNVLQNPNNNNNLNGSFHNTYNAPTQQFNPNAFQSNTMGTGGFNSQTNFGNQNNFGNQPLSLQNIPFSQNFSQTQLGYNNNNNNNNMFVPNRINNNNSHNNSFAMINNQNNARNTSFEINSYGNTQKYYAGGGVGGQGFNEFELNNAGGMYGNFGNNHDEGISHFSNARSFAENQFFGHNNFNFVEQQNSKKMLELQIIQSNQKLKGEVNYDNGSHFIGDLLSNGMRHGYGIFQFADGSQYEGNWYLNQMSGLGTLYYANGKIAYEGEWVDSKFNGYGQIFIDKPENRSIQIDYNDLTKYNENMLEFHGEFIIDKKEGFGTLTLINGDVFKGIFEDDQIHGGGVYQVKDGECISAVWKEGQLYKKYDN